MLHSTYIQLVSILDLKTLDRGITIHHLPIKLYPDVLTVLGYDSLLGQLLKVRVNDPPTLGTSPNIEAEWFWPCATSHEELDHSGVVVFRRYGCFS
jgi:hypothetical protein